MASEQWWALGVCTPEGRVVFAKRTRSRKVKARWLAQGEVSGCTPVAREVWTVGGRFDGECYASTEWGR